MKKRKLIAPIMLCAALLTGAITLSACGSEQTDKKEDVTLDSIKVTKNPTKTTYEEGEKFSSAGMELTATYSDKTIKVITAGYTYDKTGELKTSDKVVTITYEKKTTTISIVVNAKVLPATLSSIEITTQPTKVAYLVGETFDPTGMVVTANYSDETTKIIDSTKYTISKTEALNVDDKTITITYEEKTAVVNITVDYVDQAGLDLNFESNNGKHEIVNNETATEAKVTWSEVKSNEYSFVKSKIHAGDVKDKESISFDVENKNDTELNFRIDIHSETKHGEHDVTALNTYAECDDASIKPTTDLVYGGSTFKIPAKTKVNCKVHYDTTYGEVDSVYCFINSSTWVADASTATLSNGEIALSNYKAEAYVAPTVASIAVTKNPTKTEYIVGEIFDPAGMEVTATLTDKSTQVITDYTYKTTALVLTDKDFVISYVKNEETYTTNLALNIYESEDDKNKENVDAEALDLSNKLVSASGDLTLSEDTTNIQGKGTHSIKMAQAGTYLLMDYTLSATEIANLKKTTFDAYFKHVSGTLYGGKKNEKFAARFFADKTAVVKNDDYSCKIYDLNSVTAYQTLEQIGDWWHVTLDFGKIFAAAGTTDEAIATITKINFKLCYSAAEVVENIDNMSFVVAE